MIICFYDVIGYLIYKVHSYTYAELVDRRPEKVSLVQIQSSLIREEYEPYELAGLSFRVLSWLIGPDTNKE